MKHISLTIHGDDSATTLVVDINRALSPLEHVGLTTTFLQYLRDTIGDDIGAIRVDRAVDALDKARIE